MFWILYFKSYPLIIVLRVITTCSFSYDVMHSHDAMLSFSFFVLVKFHFKLRGLWKQINCSNF